MRNADDIVATIDASGEFVIEWAPRPGLFIEVLILSKVRAESIKPAFKATELIQWPPTDVPAVRAPAAAHAPCGMSDGSLGTLSQQQRLAVKDGTVNQIERIFKPDDHRTVIWWEIRRDKHSSNAARGFESQ